MTETEVAERLAKWRKSVGKTQREVAEMLGVCERTYSRYEKGEREMPEDMVKELLGSKEQGVKREQKTIPKETRLCSFKCKSVKHPNGDVTQWFLPCIGTRCMSYKDGFCTRIQ